VVVIVWSLDLQLPVQTVPISTKAVSLNYAHGELYSIQLNVIKFVSDTRQLGSFFLVLQCSPLLMLTATI
jgi:hypothetical protein